MSKSKKKIIYAFMVKKGNKETTNIHSIDFKKGTIKWAYKTDEMHNDKLENVKLFAFINKLGYIKVT